MKKFDGDRYVFSESGASIKSDISSEGTIDIELLLAETQRLGPVRCRASSSPYEVYIGVYPCECASEDCDELVVVVWRKGGLFGMRWVISTEELLSYDNLEHFIEVVVHFGLNDSHGERLLIEGDIAEAFGDEYVAHPIPPCYCTHCVEQFGNGEVWRKLVLAQLAQYVNERAVYLSEAENEGGEEGRDFAEFGFDLGYSMGRIYSEYQTRSNMEPHALAGRELERHKVKRAKSAGEKSANMRHDRMRTLLSCMEKLAADNPALLRMGAVTLAKLACEDATAQDPILWAQGGGQLDEYIGQIRRGEAGEDMQSRYLSIFPAKVRPRMKTA